MNDPQKIAVGFFVVTGAAITLTAISIRQAIEIDKLKEQNNAFRKVLSTRPGIELVKAVLEKANIDKIVSTIKIPNDIGNL